MSEVCTLAETWGPTVYLLSWGLYSDYYMNYVCVYIYSMICVYVYFPRTEKPYRQSAWDDRVRHLGRWVHFWAFSSGGLLLGVGYGIASAKLKS